MAHHSAQPGHLRVANDYNCILLRRLLSMPHIPQDEQFSFNLQTKQAGIVI
jgi:hypothetical protein